MTKYRGFTESISLTEHVMKVLQFLVNEELIPRKNSLFYSSLTLNYSKECRDIKSNSTYFNEQAFQHCNGGSLLGVKIYYSYNTYIILGKQIP